MSPEFPPTFISVRMTTEPADSLTEAFLPAKSMSELSLS